MLQHTFEAARRAALPAGITVAVDSQELFGIVTSFGGQAIQTDPNLASGTDRVVEVAKQLSDVDIFVNVQGDEPEIESEAIDQVTELLAQNPSADVATLAAPIRSKEQLDDPACVKVVKDHHDSALYFSRSPIPYVRNGEDLDQQRFEAEPPIYWQHIGIYAYRREFLMRLAELRASKLEQLEGLEQLRFLQAGCQILVGSVEASPGGIDTRADYDAFVARYNQSLRVKSKR